jgi:hypothetical protein
MRYASIGALAAASSSACGPGSTHGDATDGTTATSQSVDSTSGTEGLASGTTSLGSVDTTAGADASTSELTSTGGGVLCWPNPAWAPKVSFSSPTIRATPFGLSFTSEMPCTVVGATTDTASLACPDPRDPRLVHSIELGIESAETIDLSGLPEEVALAYADGRGFESCGDSVLRIADAQDAEILLVIAERLQGADVTPLEVELVDTECTEFAPAPQLPGGSVECRPGALHFTWPTGELDIPEDTSATLPDGLFVEVIRAGRCRAFDSSVECGTVHFTITAPALRSAR